MAVLRNDTGSMDSLSPLSLSLSQSDLSSISVSWPIVNHYHYHLLFNRCNNKITHKRVVTYIHPFNGPLSGTTRVSRYQKGKTNLDLIGARDSCGSGISWAICKSGPRCRQITTPAPHHSDFYRPDALPAAQPTVSMHWGKVCSKLVIVTCIMEFIICYV